VFTLQKGYIGSSGPYFPRRHHLKLKKNKILKDEVFMPGGGEVKVAKHAMHLPTHVDESLVASHLGVL
jgi:hypothetical protein